MSGHDSKYFSTTKKGEIPELKEELNSQYKVIFCLSLCIYVSASTNVYVMYGALISTDLNIDLRPILISWPIGDVFW